MKKLNIGSGSKRIDGYLGVDIVPFPNVDIVSSAWALPCEDSSIDEILSEHMIEHLTFEEFNKSIVEWYRVLKENGCLIIECPDLLGICREFISSNDFNRYVSFKGYWPLIAHFYGHQRGNSPEEKFGQIHKSGYTQEHLEFHLKGVGFTSFTNEPPKKCNPHSPTIRIKAMKNG